MHDLMLELAMSPMKLMTHANKPTVECLAIWSDSAPIKRTEFVVFFTSDTIADATEAEEFSKRI